MVKKTDVFHIQIAFELVAEISKPAVVPTARCYNCVRVPCKLIFYSFINSRTIRMHFNSHSELNFCFKVINDSLVRFAAYTYEIFRQLLSNYVQLLRG